MAHRDQEKWEPARPKQVDTAVRLIYASVIVSLISSIIGMVISFLTRVEFAVTFAVLTCSSVSLILTIYIATKIADGRNWARWLMLILVVLGAAAIICDYRSYISQPLVGSATVIVTLLQISAVILLFRQPANAWFNSTIQVQEPEAAPEELLTTADTRQAVGVGSAHRSGGVELDEIPQAKMMTIAGAVGAVMGLLNAAYWSVASAPQSSSERDMIYILIAAGLVLGGALGAAGGLFFLSRARRNPDRSPIRWAIFGGFLGGLLSFSCCFLAGAFIFVLWPIIPPP